MLALSWGCPVLRGVVYDSSSALLDVQREAEILQLSPAVPRVAGPQCRMTQVHSTMDSVPFRAPRYLLTARPVGRDVTSTEFTGLATAVVS